VGIFSLFGKKDSQPALEPVDKEHSRKNRGEGSPRADSVTEAGRAQIIQRSAARATAMKIDAIESEMSNEFVRPVRTAANNTIPGPATITGSPAATTAVTGNKPEAKKKPAGFQATLPMGTTTGFFLGGETLPGSVLLSASEATPVIEEAAILFANGQTEMVEQVLQDAIRENLGASALTVWAMLLELYQVTGRRAEFDSLSIDYASKFETSPPGWFESEVGQPAAPITATKTTPSIPFSGKLDGTMVKQLERVKKLAETSKVLRLEFVRVTEVDPVGCGILLSVLKKLEKTGHDLILVGALELVGKIRAILEVGRRDETEAPWLLLMEVLQLLNLEKDFEEASIDYCITFEVSPPPFVAPKTKVTMALDDPTAKDDSPHFMMPAVIEGSTDQLIQAISAHVSENFPAILDCARLTRVDFGATGQLLAGLAPLTGAGSRIELHNVNQLVAALFTVMGLKDIVKIVPRKH
jgi:ABC-type transporter Mla MlaB component